MNIIHVLFDIIKIMISFVKINKYIMLPCNCPSCRAQLKVKSLLCENCGTEVHGLYALPVLARLPVEDQEFVLKFVKNSGSLKDMAKDLGLS